MASELQFRPPTQSTLACLLTFPWFLWWCRFWFLHCNFVMRMEDTPNISFWIFHEDLVSLMGPLQGVSRGAASCCSAALALFVPWGESADMAWTASEWCVTPALSADHSSSLGEESVTKPHQSCYWLSFQEGAFCTGGTEGQVIMWMPAKFLYWLR